ncbi:hypothetical protein M427DRAFT_171987 [Gonapodya prolifera JEL478]|uniref:Uncharacterized protein n=1 Tax=Gonapodya prolifera (strain JEL478) TaxID=1344416 RepID=A0A139B093_GONPJ|nr:hypothetical protein M427DRAFT_171987 [Gonapodya prolifera JEL478]|eukprot:KXS22411.1 hypothetical protein M427DRAFT_171987 [Gonapodya prolifera JEL478]
MVYEDTDSECDYNYDSDDSWGGGGYRYRRGGYYVDSEGGKEIALANWVRNRTRTAVFCSSSEDPDTNARPPSSLWDRIDGLMLDKWGWARLKIKTRALLRTVGGGGVNEAAGAGAAVGAEGTAGDVVATAPAPPASARPLIKKLTTSPTTSFSKLPATVLSSLVKLVLFSDPAPAPGVLESSDDQDACLHRILARKVEREADAKVVGEKIGAAVAKARKAAKGGGSMENN